MEDDFEIVERKELLRKDLPFETELPDMEVTIAVPPEQVESVQNEVAACTTMEEVAMLMSDLARRFRVVKSKGVSTEVH